MSNQRHGEKPDKEYWTSRSATLYRVIPGNGYGAARLSWRGVLCFLPAERNGMENQPQPEVIKKNSLAGYVVAGLVWTFAQNFAKSTADQLVVLVIAIGTGYFYHRLKAKIKIRSEVLRVVITFIIIEVAAGFLVGFLTALV